MSREISIEKEGWMYSEFFHLKVVFIHFSLAVRLNVKSVPKIVRIKDIPYFDTHKELRYVLKILKKDPEHLYHVCLSIRPTVRPNLLTEDFGCKTSVPRPTGSSFIIKTAMVLLWNDRNRWYSLLMWPVMSPVVPLLSGCVTAYPWRTSWREKNPHSVLDIPLSKFHNRWWY